MHKTSGKIKNKLGGRCLEIVHITHLWNTKMIDTSRRQRRKVARVLNGR